MIEEVNFLMALSCQVQCERGHVIFSVTIYTVTAYKDIKRKDLYTVLLSPITRFTSSMSVSGIQMSFFSTYKYSSNNVSKKLQTFCAHSKISKISRRRFCTKFIYNTTSKKKIRKRRFGLIQILTSLASKSFFLVLPIFIWLTSTLFKILTINSSQACPVTLSITCPKIVQPRLE